MRAEIISIGDELTRGLALDTNSAWLSQRLAALGIAVRRHQTIADDQADIRQSISDAAASAEIVLITGGLGPTADDLTRPALAEALGEPLETDQQALADLEAFFARLDRPMTESNRVQAERPRGAVTIRNSRGTAPGIRARLGTATIYVMPGVPGEMMTMFEQSIVPELTALAGDRVIAARTLHCFGVAEATVGEKIAHLMRRGRNPSVGTTAKDAVISVRIVAEGNRGISEIGSSDPTAQQMLDRDADEIRSLLGTAVFGEEIDTLESVVAAELIRRGLTIATAESCTGGLLAKRLTDTAGSSAYFLRGFVTYSNQAKTDLLGVPESMLAAHGAVSEPVAASMASGCRQACNADYALSITGIAGPTGGTPDKPVGLVCIGLADRTDVRATRHLFGEHLTRAEIRDRTCKTALNLLRLRLL